MPRISNASPRASRNTRNGPSPLQSRLSALLREARWIFFAALAAWLTLVLATWSPADPGWSHSALGAGAGKSLHNGGGAVGAYLADVLYYLFGFSAWWWVVLLVHRVRAGYRRLATQLRAIGREPEPLPRVHWEQGVGFFLLFAGSLGLEALRLRSLGMHLPGVTGHSSGAGGVIGQLLAGWLSRVLGFDGGTLVLLVLVVVGLSLFFAFSWLDVAERVGGWLEQGLRAIVNAYTARQDRRVGEVARLFADSGLIVLVSFISPFRSERRMARDLLPPGEFIEVFVDTPIELCMERDPKGLYEKARAGQIKNFTGVDSPYEAPEAAEITLHTAERSAEDLANDAVAYLRDKGIV